MHLGQTPERYDLALSLAKLTRVVDYDSANLTLIAEAGMPLCEVYRLTTPCQQFLPLGYAGTTASLGGLLVTNTSGVKRLRYGERARSGAGRAGGSARWRPGALWRAGGEERGRV